MLISDWSSDVCSSDLKKLQCWWRVLSTGVDEHGAYLPAPSLGSHTERCEQRVRFADLHLRSCMHSMRHTRPARQDGERKQDRSEEKRVGKECGSTYRTGGSPYP